MNGATSTNLCSELLDAMKKRKSDLIDNRAILCSTFIDPRYKANLSVDQTALAKVLLVNMWNDVKQLKASEQANDIIDSNSPSHIDNDEDELENYFRDKCGEPTADENEINEAGFHGPIVVEYSMNNIEFLKEFERFDTNTPRMHHSESILKFWESSKFKYPELFAVATILLGIPPSQATVERTFSVLGFVFNSRRWNLDQNTLEQIICMKMNHDLAQDIFTEEMQEI